MQQKQINYYSDLGTVEYNKAMEIQKKLVSMRKENKIKNTILFLDHPDVYTIGRKSSIENYKNVNPVRTDRGGDVTYHGPGQLVAYFIFDVRIDGKVEVGKFLRNVEAGYLNFLNKKGYNALLGPEPGIWIRKNDKEFKVASLGMAIDNYISYHGMALNISQNVLKGFQLINPCGMNSNVIYYIDIDRAKAINGLIEEFTGIFGDFQNIDKENFLA